MKDAPAYDRTVEDLGNVVTLEHVNTRVPDQQLATLFYVTGLGLTRDPYLMTSVTNMWVNVGRSQFHLPTGNPQVLRGHTGLVIPNREALVRRLGAAKKPAEDERGRHAWAGVGAGQRMIFRETDAAAPAFDGHHVAIYLADFSGPHRRLLERGLVTEESDQHQYRFENIIDMASGRVLFTIEHEVRSMRHPLYARPLVNRNPEQTNRLYAPGHEELSWSLPVQ
jgi:hypothetical protein